MEHSKFAVDALATPGYSVLRVGPEPGTVRIEHDEQALSPEWDAFVLKCGVPHFEQTSLWGKVKTHAGWNASRAIVRLGDSICGGAQVLTRRVGSAGSIGYVFRGPLVYPESEDCQKWVARAMRAYAGRRRLSCLIVVPPYRAFPLVQQMRAEGFGTHPECLPPTGITQATGVVDLRPEIETVYARMARRTCRYIRRGEREGVLVRPGTREDIGLFWRLVVALCGRRGVSPNIPDEKFVEKLWDTLSPAGLIQMLIGEVRNRPVCALIALRAGQWVSAWRSGWSGDYPELHPPLVLYWKAFQSAKSAGASFFDFLQVDPHVADLVAAKKTVDHLPWAGATLYKLRLGSEVWRVPPTMNLYAGPLLGLLMRCGGPILLSSSLARKAIGLIPLTGTA
jgi:peptidoglycan pentaglycine glycine transferase (the first glycine)